MRSPILSLVFVVSMLASTEGAAETVPLQGLRADTDIYVDILDHLGEDITFTGIGDADLYGPDGTHVMTTSSGQTQWVGANGTYMLDIHSDQDLWDVTVGPGKSGRVWSYAWQFDGGGFDESTSLTTSFYAVIPGGGRGYDAVVELAVDGLAGFVYTVSGNALGVDGTDGRSVPSAFGITWGQDYQIYLNPPEEPSYEVLDQEVSAASYRAGALGCDVAVPGVLDGEFVFVAYGAGGYHVVCDTDEDGSIDLTAAGDLHLLGPAGPGYNQLGWDGRDNYGEALPPGTYSCVVTVTSGEFHFVASDIETSFAGLRMFAVDADRTRLGLPMFWNDTEVMDNAGFMPDGQAALHTSGPAGIPSGLYADPAFANVNARAWGRFAALSKGNQALLDTYTWLSHDTSDAFEISILDLGTDSDQDGIVDVDESCTHGTDPTRADTDGDSLSDADEILVLPTDPARADTDGDGVFDACEIGDIDDPGDTDGDGIIDALDTDDDDDGVPTALESAGDTDGDGIVDYLDVDDDGDGLSTRLEGLYDTDEDGIPDHLDADDDNDGQPTLSEGLIDSDGDGFPDCRDADDDGDGIGSSSELGDTDGDGIPDALDPDDDGDGIPTQAEGGIKVDTDGDGLFDYLDDDDDGDSVDTIKEIGDSDGDGILDRHDPDDDGDGLPTLDEVGADTDGNGIDDYLDPDDDGDGILTSDEVAWFDSDVDGDGVPNWHDRDSDGDRRLDSAEGTGDSDGDGVPDFVDPDAMAPVVVAPVLPLNPADDDDGDDGLSEDDELVRLLPDGSLEALAVDRNTPTGCATTGSAHPSLWLFALLGLVGSRARRAVELRGGSGRTPRRD